MATDAYRIRLLEGKGYLPEFCALDSQQERCFPDAQRTPDWQRTKISSCLAICKINMSRTVFSPCTLWIYREHNLELLSRKSADDLGAWRTLRLSISDGKFYFIFHRFCLRDLGRFVQPALFWWGLRVAARDQAGARDHRGYAGKC